MSNSLTINNRKEGDNNDETNKKVTKASSVPIINEKGEFAADLGTNGSLRSFRSPDSNVEHSEDLENESLRTQLHSNASIDNASSQKNKFGLFTCIAVVMGIMIGSGILGNPQRAYEYTNNELVCLLIWLAVGILSTLGALCYAELGATLPLSGGDYSYINKIFGPLCGFIYQWSSIIVVIPVSRAIMALTVAHNLIGPYVENSKCHPNLGVAWSIKCLAIGLVGIFSAVNCMSRSVVSKLNGTLFIIKLVTIASVLICGVVFMSRHGIYTYTNFTLAKNPENSAKKSHSCSINGTKPSVTTYQDQASQIVIAIYQVSFSYLGFNFLNFIAEEVSNPKRNLPLAIIISLPIIVFVYVFINFTYFVSLSGEKIMNSDIIIHDLYEAVIPRNLHSYTLWLAPTAVAVAVAGSLMSQIMSTTRIPFIGARNGHVPKFLALVHKKHLTPTPAIIFTSIVSVLVILVAGEAKILISVGSYLENGFIIVSISALIHLRLKEPHVKRPIKLPLVIPITYVVISLALFLSPIFTIAAVNAAKTLKFIGGALFTVVTGIPVYLFFVKKEPKPACIVKYNGKFTAFVERILDVIPNDSMMHNL